MDLRSKRATAAVSTSDDGDANGSFDLLLSSSALDRDGERLLPSEWAQPFPDSIPINVDHSKSVSDVIGSGRPFLDSAGNLRVKGTFASSDAAQHVRGLVSEGHLRSVSVEFLRRKSASGQPVNELIGGAFVNVPANPEARVLASKAFRDGLSAVLAGKSVAEAIDPVTMTQAIHDASVHIGANCGGLSEDGVDGAADGANKARGDITDDDGNGDDYDYSEDDEKSLAMQALRLRVKALAR
jgi:hypothetical protein